MHQEQNNYPKFQTHENEGACRSEKLSGTRKRDQSLFSLLLEVERRLRTEDRNDQVHRLKRSKQKDRRHSRVKSLSRYCE
jgi:hypothetical protein